MQCRQCGTESGEAFKFCANCGHPLSPEHEDSASQESAISDSATPETSANSAAENTSTVRSNPFSEFYSPQTEPSGLQRALLIILAAVAIVGAATGAAYYFGHRKYEIAELAKLKAAPQAPAAKQDEIFPCPLTTPFCIGTTASKIKDPACSSDKPIWAHYSEDGGSTWKRAGCYATEAEARQGLSDTLGVKSTSVSKTTNPPRKTAASRADKTAAKPPKPQSASPESGREETAAKYHVSFKGPFGITVEKRTYPNEQMKQKALDLWEREKKILEPDGSINDKYVLKQKPASGLIPGH